MNVTNEMTSIRCTYQIAVKAKWVELVFNNLFDVDSNMPDCYSNYVEVSIGCGASAKTLSRFCSLNAGKPHDLYARDGCIKITYSEFSHGRRGFSAQYRSHLRIEPKTKSKCSVDRKNYVNQGLIVSPGWPFMYMSDYFPFSGVCNWEIMVSSNRKIKLNIMDVDLHVEGNSCYNEYTDTLRVTGKRSVTGASSSTRTYCRKNPFSLTTEYYDIGLSLRKSSNLFGTGRGFVVGYVSYTINAEPIKFNFKHIIGAAAGFFALCIFIYLCCRCRRHKRYESISSCDSDSDSDCCVGAPNYGTTTTTTTICEPQPPPAPGYYPPQPGYGPQPGPYKPASQAYPAYPPSYPAAQPGSQPYPPTGYPPNYQPYAPQTQVGTAYPGNAPPPYTQQ